MAALLILAAALGARPAAAGEEYLLGPQDKVRLKIYEWRASRDAIFEWTALNDTFTIGADGTLSLPFVGSVEAEGQAPNVVAGTIADRLAMQMGLGQPPDVAVEVVQFRPFYISGQVAQPGEFPYRPGLTVLQAVSIAGGLRTREESVGRIEREVIAGRGDVSLLWLSQISLQARRARLQAEQKDADSIDFPAALTKGSAAQVASVIVEQERAVFAARRDSLSTQRRALTELRSFLDRETASLRQQIGYLDQQIDSVKAELASVTTLVDQGLAVAPRQMALERSLLQVQSDRVSAETSLLRAQQEISRTDISILEQKNNRANEVADALRDTELQLSENDRRTDTALTLLHDSEETAPRMLALNSETGRPQAKYTIVRPTTDGGTLELPATEATAVQPGDTVKVDIPLSATFDLGGLIPDADLTGTTLVR